MFHPTVWLWFLDNASVSIVFNFLLFLLWWWVLLYYTHLNTQVIFYILFYDWQVHLTLANRLVSCSVQKPSELSTARIGSYLLIQHLNWYKTSLVEWFELLYSLAMTYCWIYVIFIFLFSSSHLGRKHAVLSLNLVKRTNLTRQQNYAA